jgi:uncharacterized membrane protein YgaE (UPF0421/DUF939 family)
METEMMYQMPWSDRIVNGTALIVMGVLFLRESLPIAINLATTWVASVGPVVVSVAGYSELVGWFLGVQMAFVSVLIAFSPFYVAHKVLLCLFREMMEQ